MRAVRRFIDGRWITFISDRDGNMNLWVARSDGSSPRQLTRENRFPHSSPVWGRDGMVVVRRSARTGREVWAVHPEGGDGYRLTVGGNLDGPTLSPDGRTSTSRGCVGTTA